jgi:hypothetical protein
MQFRIAKEQKKTPLPSKTLTGEVSFVLKGT